MRSCRGARGQVETPIAISLEFPARCGFDEMAERFRVIGLDTVGWPKHTRRRSQQFRTQPCCKALLTVF